MRKIILILLALAAIPAAHAAVLTVTNPDDHGSGCLRHCVSIAQPGDEIRFDPSLDGQPLVLSGGDPVSLDKNLTITGRGSEKTIIDGDFNGLALYVSNGSAVRISKVTVRHGAVAGIYVDRGAVELDEAVVTANRFGYGIYSRGGSLKLTDTVVSDNFDSAYGVFQYQGDLTLTDTTIRGNWRGLYSYDGVVTLTHSAVSDNEREGIFAVRAWITIDDSIVSGNGGGGIYNQKGWLTVTESTVSDNTAANGAGIYNGGLLTLDGSTISGNAALLDGGGLYNRSDTGAWIANSTIAGNAATRRGGGLYDRDDKTRLVVASSTIAGNLAGEDGGGIFSEDGDLLVRNSIIAGHPVGGDCGAIPVRSAGHNLDGDDSCGLDQPTDQPGADPMLRPLEAGYGPTRTRVPLGASPVIDRGWCDSATDQRGVPRPLDGDRDGVRVCDVGAVEYVPYAIRLVSPTGEVIVLPADGGE